MRHPGWGQSLVAGLSMPGFAGYHVRHGAQGAVVKIGYVINTYPRPSHSFIRREIMALERQGITIHRFAMRDDRENLLDPGDIAEHGRTEHILKHGAGPLAGAVLRRLAKAPRRLWAALRLALRLGGVSPVGRLRHLIYLAEACTLAGRCERLGITHLHAHFGTNSSLVALLVQAVGGPPFSFTVHGPEEFDCPAALALGEKIHRAAFTVAVSAYGRSQLCRWAEYDDWPRIHVVHCGIEPALFSTPPALPPGPGRRLVAIGRLVEQKGQLVLIEALALARRRCPDLRLVLVGEGAMRGVIEAAIAAHHLQHAVTITGWVDEARVRSELAQAHGLVLPSFAEGLPMVVMEAMAAARPVIATYIAGIPELVLPGDTGWLVPAGEVAALAGALVAFARSPADRLAAMGAAGRARVLDRHDVDLEAAKLGRLFATAIAG